MPPEKAIAILSLYANDAMYIKTICESEGYANWSGMKEKANLSRLAATIFEGLTGRQPTEEEIDLISWWKDM